jgi:UDP-hydrolysing UDP-N-acetyl-D-glucosamine 2-epimerase
MPLKRKLRRVCFVTGTRAEFGLMESTLRAIAKDRGLALQLVVTGTHTHRSRGRTVDEIRRAKCRIDRVIEWEDSSNSAVIARETGRVTAALVDTFEKLRSDVVLVVGDRVEAFAAATAAHLSGRVVAHVHGGDRAMGQADDSLRHAISKLAHLHFPATAQSAERLYQLGEERSRIVVAGAPGIDGILRAAASRAIMRKVGLDYAPGFFTLLLLHPTDDRIDAERKRTELLIKALRSDSARPIVALLPNNDPGAVGIADALQQAAARGEIHLYTHASRRLFLGLMRDCRVLVGNSSAGIIEAGSFATPVVNIGPRQQGRERGSNVIDASFSTPSIRSALVKAVAIKPTRVADNPYDRGGAGPRIATALSRVRLDAEFRRKLIRY